MSHTVCEKCKLWIFEGSTHKCRKVHNCAVDGHVGKRGLITMFVCEKCGYSSDLAPELVPSEAELCVGQGIDYSHHYEGDD